MSLPAITVRSPCLFCVPPNPGKNRGQESWGLCFLTQYPPTHTHHPDRCLALCKRSVGICGHRDGREQGNKDTEGIYCETQWRGVSQQHPRGFSRAPATSQCPAGSEAADAVTWYQPAGLVTRFRIISAPKCHLAHPGKPCLSQRALPRNITHTLRPQREGRFSEAKSWVWLLFLVWFGF